MQEIKLIQMRISNFKGIRELDIAFHGRDMNVLGDNGTGKTSIIDSFTWLLFGKDSLDRADFGIKPTDSEGNIIHQLETSVEAVFDVSGVEKVFKKTLNEVWTRRRGAAEAEFTRNENNFFIDGVPKKKAEYTAAIKELIDEEVFKIITNPLYFNESVNWKDRRSTLLTICGEVSDEEVIASSAELSPLLPILQGKSVSDFKDITASSMRRINQELDMIPVKISEAERAKPSEEELEVDQGRKVELTVKIEALRTQRSSILNGTEALNERQKIRMLRQELKVTENIRSLNNIPEAVNTAQIEEEIRNHEMMLRNTERNRNTIADKIVEKMETREKLSEKWDEIFAERFTDTTCPTCHRELPEEEIESRTKAFNRDKAEALDNIEKKNEKIGAEIAELEAEVKEDTESINAIKAGIEKLHNRLAKANEENKAILESKVNEYDKKRSEIEEQIAEAEEKIRSYEESTEEAVKEIESQIASLSSEMVTIDEALAKRALLERQEQRIAELREQQIRLATEYTKEERNLYLAEQFIIAKVNMLNERINEKFKYAKFKLFDRQINGGINEVCEVTYNGIPYKDLNNAMRINIGLDVINTISAHYGIIVPILIDNAESVNVIYHTEAQQVRFYVSQDKKLQFISEG